MSIESRSLHTGDCKGTRGGARVIYIDYCQYGKVYLIGIYKKNVKTDLSSDERKSLNRMLAAIENALKANNGR